MIELIKLVSDFVCCARNPQGYGLLKYNFFAIQIASGLSQTQIKKFRRHNIIPAAFFIWLRESKIFPTISVPCGGTSYQLFKDIVDTEIIGSSELKLSISKYENLKLISKECLEEFSKYNCSQENIWRKLEIMKRYPKKLHLYDARGQHSKKKGGLSMAA